MTDIATSEVLLSELPTKEVVIAPKQVTVVREIYTSIKPGQNEITILGLDRSVDFDSVRIEGSGAATITDIQTDLVPQRENFDDIYPESEDDKRSDEDEDISEDEDGLDDPELREIRNEIQKLEESISMARSDINSALSILNIIDSYGKELHNDKKKDLSKLDDFLKIYSERRGAEAERHHKATVEVNVREKDLAKLQRKFDRRKARYLREQRTASKAIRLRNEKRARAREQKTKQRDLKRNEQRYFWASTIGQVVVSLDSQSVAITPGSSGRSSVIEKAVDRTGDIQEPIDVMLRLSYIVPGPGWSPRYELRINSPSSSARMTYRAELRNSCTETWRDARVTLSTSQASFSGIGVRIPLLDTWSIKLVTAVSKAPSWDRILETPKPLFGPTPPCWQPGGLFGPPAPLARRPQQGGLFGSSTVEPAAAQPPRAMSLFGAPATSTTNGFGAAGSAPAGGFGSYGQQSVAQSRTPPIPQQANAPLQEQHMLGPGPSLFGGAPPPPPPPAAAPTTSPPIGAFSLPNTQPKNTEEPPRQENIWPTNINTAVELEEDDADTQTLTSGALEHQDAVKQDYGMTTIYELPGRRTLAPSFVSRRHVLAEFDLQSVALTYVIIPKLKEAAFLRARIKNTSSLTLHGGQVGITVDGSFVGAASLDTCAPNVFFNISLGIDPGIEVKYAKPTVKPMTGAMFFNKEDGAKFRRACWVKNTKGTAVDVIVSDQVPVSEDEKLRVRIIQPYGLEKEGDESPVDMEARKGHSTARLHKNGEVKWTLRLEPGQEIRLVLEYEAKVPSGSDVITSS